MTTSHEASCRCADCRARRAARAAQGLNQSGQVPLAPVRSVDELAREAIEREELERQTLIAAIQSDPMAFILENRDNGADFDSIAAALAQSGIDHNHIVALIDEARSILNATRRRRGLRRIVLGIGVAGVGVGASIGLSSLIPGGWIAFWGLALFGLFQAGKGVYVMAALEKSE